MKKKTICDAIKEVLKDEKDGLTYLEIHSQIEEKSYMNLAQSRHKR